MNCYHQSTIDSVIAAVNSGIPVRQAAKRYAVAESTARGWVKRASANATVNTPEPTDDASSAIDTTQGEAVAVDSPGATLDATEDSARTNAAEATAPLPIRIGDVREMKMDGSWKYGYKIIDYGSAYLAIYVCEGSPDYARITRDGLPVAGHIGLTCVNGPDDLSCYSLDDFVFSGVYRGYQVGIDSEGIIRQYRVKCSSVDLGWLTFDERHGDLPVLILDYIAQFIPIVYAQPFRFSLNPPAIVATESPEDSTEDSTEDITCDDCGCELTEDTAHKQDGETYCDSCFSDHYETCSHCDSIVPSEDANTEDNEIWCDECHSNNFTSCSQCRNSTPNEDTLTTEDGNDICPSCYEDHYFTCDDCDEIYRDSSVNSTDDGRYCNSCYRENGHESSELIRDYGDKSADHFRKLGKPKGGLYFGVELEVCARNANSRDDSAEDVMSALGEDYCVLKEDGSLPSGGFEIVTCPASIDIHAERFRSLMVEHPVSGLKSWDSPDCGMHVHASKDAISPLTIGKLLVFVNDDRHRDFITTIAGRDANTYCQRSKKKLVDSRSRRWDRYESINLTNSHTIEFRIFKGTLKYTSFMKNLEFVASSIAFCKLAGCQELSVRNFCNFLESYKLAYPHLHAFLASKGHVKPSKRVESTLNGSSIVGAEV